MNGRLANWKESLWSEINRSVPFRWGHRDCFLFVDSCVAAMTGRTIKTDWRGTYSDREGAEWIVEQCGGMVAFGDELLQGYARTTEPDEGDAVVVRLPGDVLMAGMHTGGTRVALLPENGDVVLAFNLPIVAAWSIN